MSMVGAALVLTVLGVVRLGGAGAPAAVEEEKLGTARNLLEAPQFKEIIVEAVHNAWGDRSPSREALQEHTGRILREFSDLLDEHLSTNELLAIQNAQINDAVWQDLRQVLRGLKDQRLVSIGRRSAELLRNTSLSSEEVVRRMRYFTQAMDLRDIEQDLIPPRFRQASAGQAPNNVFATMFDPQARAEIQRPPASPEQVPQGEAVARQVGHMRYLAELATRKSGASASARALREGTWLLPTELTGMEFATGAVATVLVFVSEIVVHLGIIINFHMPVWGWLLVYSPAIGFGVPSCIIGLTLYCDMILGVLGFNAIEAAFVFTLFKSGPYGSSAAAPQIQGSTYLAAPAPPPPVSNSPAFSIQSYEGEATR